MSYDDVRPWARAIKSKVVAREMPPWGADPAQSLKMRNDPSLSKAQIDTIVAWVDGGAPRGSDAEMPAPPTFATGWTHGSEPDYVLEMPVEFDIPAEGELGVQMFYSPVPFKEDRFAEVVELRPGNRGVVHHAGIFLVDIPEGTRIVDGRLVGEDGKVIGDRGAAGLPRTEGMGLPGSSKLLVVGARAAASISTAIPSASAFPPASTSTGRCTTTRPASPRRIGRDWASGSTRSRSRTKC